MKTKSLFQDKNYKSASLPDTFLASDVKQNETDFAPAAEGVAMRAYFIYLRQGSLPGHDLQHWLEAEAQLRAERTRPLVRVFPTRNRLTFESPRSQGVTRVRQNGIVKATPNYEHQLY